jgi:hypothetical protein
MPRRNARLAYLVVIFRLKKIDAVVRHDVYDSMFLRETTGPRPRREILQRFWFADSRERITHDGFDKVENAEGDLAIVLNPITKILAKLVLENSSTTFLPRHGRRYSSKPTSRRSLAIV